MAFESWGTYKTPMGSEKWYKISNRSNTLCTPASGATKKERGSTLMSTVLVCTSNAQHATHRRQQQLL